MIIKNGSVLLFEEGGFVKRDVLVKDGKITKVSSDIKGEEIFDATGMFITPGLIDAHSHLCVSEEGMGEIGDDCNDYSGALTPELETIDAIYPFDIAVKTSVRAGVTAVCTCPGSDSIIGGVASTIRLSGKVAEDMIIKRKTAIKCSLGENPKKVGNGFKSRMGNAYTLRKGIEDAIDYKHRKEDAASKNDYFRTDIGMENMLLALGKEIPIHVHVHRSDDICTAIRIATQYDLRLVLVHCTDGMAIVDHLAKFDYPIIVGPTMYPRSKLESMSRCFETAGVLSNAGLKVCITADHDVTPLYYLSVYAAQSVRAGMSEIDGLKAITKNPAEVLGIADIKGQIKEGLDADIVIWTKHPFAYDTKVVQVLLEGKEMCD